MRVFLRLLLFVWSHITPFLSPRRPVGGWVGFGLENLRDGKLVVGAAVRESFKRQGTLLHVACWIATASLPTHAFLLLVLVFQYVFRRIPPCGKPW